MKKQSDDKPRKPRILIVDDSNYQRSKTKRVLKDNGFSVIEAIDGLQGLQVFREKSPDLVLLDINMPIMEGTEVLDFIYRIDPEALVVMFSTLDEKQLIIECLKKGAKDYLVKPSEPEIIVSTIRKHLAAKESDNGA